jgi:hypothetical protein
MPYTLNDTDPGGKSNQGLPIYTRLPRSGEYCHWTGLSRSKLNQLILPCDENGHCPPVKSLSLRPRGALKGTRLILLESLLDYLSSQLEGGEG